MHMKKILKTIGIILACIAGLAVLFFAVAAITEYRPADKEAADLITGSTALDKKDITLVSWNIGYAGLDKDSNFFMDGGTEVNPESKARVKRNIDGINSVLDSFDADFYFVQEIDRNSSRTRFIDQTAEILSDQSSKTYAPNFKTLWIPYPLPMLGHMNSGIFTATNYAVSSAERIKLPCPFSWPMSMFNLKRCLLVSYIPIEGQDNFLVLINLHLEAFDSGEGKVAQTKALLEIIEQEYNKGNYVIAGGDFNQRFPGAEEKYPQSEDPIVWCPGSLETDALPEGWQYAYDLSTPSCRSMEKALTDPATHQFYLIDGFILSPNIELVDVETIQKNFEYSDHNPVELHITLK